MPDRCGGSNNKVNPKQNKYLQPTGSPVDSSTPQTAYVPWEFGVQQGIQSKTIRLSKLDIKNIIQLSDNAIGTGSFANGGNLFLSTTLSPNIPHITDINFAVPFVAIYQGTYASTYDPNFQIYPTAGGSITPFSYNVQFFTDWHLYDGINSAAGGVIQNNTGGAQVISFITQWKYLFYSQGTAS